MTRTEAINKALAEIKALWPAAIKTPDIERRVVGKLNLAYNYGQFHEVITSILETEPRRPENIIQIITKHIHIVHGPQQTSTVKQYDDPEIDWTAHSNSECAKMFQRICGCVMRSGRAIDKNALIECYQAMLQDPNRYYLSEEQEMGLRSWIEERAKSQWR